VPRIGSYLLSGHSPRAQPLARRPTATAAAAPAARQQRAKPPQRRQPACRVGAAARVV
jgi:hypothetical protein